MGVRLRRVEHLRAWSVLKYGHGSFQFVWMMEETDDGIEVNCGCNCSCSRSCGALADEFRTHGYAASCGVLGRDDVESSVCVIASHASWKMELSR
jgi:hypothetical protein